MARKLSDDETWIFDNAPARAQLFELTETEAFWRKLAEKRERVLNEADIWLDPASSGPNGS